jgi:hypothetical protein
MSVENIASEGFLTSGAYFKPFSTKPNRQRAIGSECPLWVRSGHGGMSDPCPLYPQKRTSGDYSRMSAKCQKRTYAPQQMMRSRLIRHALLVVRIVLDRSNRTECACSNSLSIET